MPLKSYSYVQIFAQLIFPLIFTRVFFCKKICSYYLYYIEKQLRDAFFSPIFLLVKISFD